MLERLLFAHLIPHVSTNLCRLQSGYRRYRSTETVLLRITNDLFEAADAKKVIVQLAMELSASFDTTDHSVLLQRLKHTFWVSGSALSWIRSYLHHRPRFCVARSSTIDEEMGVLHGSHSDHFFSRNLWHHNSATSSRSAATLPYADDTQLYIAVDHETVGSASTNLSACTAAIYEWLLHTCPDKSESALFSTVARIKSLHDVVSVNVKVKVLSFFLFCK